MKRRERTRQLIELGGLIVKAGLVELTEDDRAVLFGLMMEGAARLQGADCDETLTLWRRRGARAFALAAETDPSSGSPQWMTIFRRRLP